MSLIEVNNLSLSYENMTVIDNLSFKVESGDYLCIVGENGSGKSTLVKALLSLKKPLSGSIELGDGLKQKEIGYLSQQTGAQRDFPASVNEVVLSGCLNSRSILPFYSRKDYRNAIKNMKRLGVDDLRKRSYRDLSGGQQQRVLLARALCATKKLLLLDEPITGLDPMAAAELYELISKINKWGVTVIMVTHDISAALRYSNNILCMRENKWYFGSVEEFKNSKASDFLKGGADNV